MSLARGPERRPTRPKKSFGQHFLRDEHYLEEIVRALEARPGESVVEVGAGRGALTARLLAAGLRVHALELDRDLEPELRGRFGSDPRFSLTMADACAMDYSLLGDSFKVAGNLPYQSATAITSRLLQTAARIPLMVLTYQREVARRITAQPGSRSYGYLTCLVRYHADAEYLMTIPPGAFWPPPKVHSGVVRLRPHPVLPLSSDEKDKLFDLIQHAFSGRRKTLLNSLSASRIERGNLRDTLAGWGIDAGRRPETFSLDEFMLLRKILAWEKEHPPGKRPGAGTGLRRP